MIGYEQVFVATNQEEGEGCEGSGYSTVYCNN